MDHGYENGAGEKTNDMNTKKEDRAKAMKMSMSKHLEMNSEVNVS